MYGLCVGVWKNCIPQWILSLYTKRNYKSTLFHIVGGCSSLGCILVAISTYYSGPMNLFYASVITFCVLSILISIRFVRDDNKDCGCCGKLIMFIIKLSVFGLLPLVMIFIVIFGIICLLSNVGIYIFNIHKKIDKVHKSYLLQKRDFWVLYRFSIENKWQFLKLKQNNKYSIFQVLIGAILSLIYFPITCISSLFWGIGQIEKDILTFPISSVFSLYFLEFSSEFDIYLFIDEINSKFDCTSNLFINILDHFW